MTTGDDSAYQRELGEAHSLFTEMGATGHAERIAKEMEARGWGLGAGEW